MPGIKSKVLVAKLASWLWNVRDSGSPVVNEWDIAAVVYDLIREPEQRSEQAVEQTGQCRYKVIMSRNPTGMGMVMQCSIVVNWLGDGPTVSGGR